MREPKLRLEARFQLDTSGRPRYEKEDDKRHYYIDLHAFVDEPAVHSVTYALDPTYYDSRREVDDRSNNFHEEITSYGDYKLTVYAHAPSGTLVEKELLSKLLATSHMPPENEDVAKALEDIRKN